MAPEPRGAPRPRPIFIALSTTAALAALLACLAGVGTSAGPLLALLGGGLAAGALAAAYAARQPSLAADLPPFFALAPGLVGMLTSLGAPTDFGAGTLGELLLRGAALAVVCAALAVACPYPRAALGLMAGALAAPGLVVLVWALAALTPQLAGGAQGATVALLFVLYLAALALWGVALRRLRPLEAAHAALARRFASAAPPARVEGWYNPAEQRRRSLALVASARPESRLKALAEMRAVRRQYGALTAAARRDLEGVARGTPEALLVLAEDADARGRPAEAEAHLAALERAILADHRLAWLAPAAREALAGTDEGPLGDACRRLEDALFVAEYAADQDRPAAYGRAYNALTNRPGPLTPESRAALDQLAAARPEAAALLAEDDFLRDAPEAGLLRLARLLRAPAGQQPADARALWERHQEKATAAVQQAIWRAHAERSGDDTPLTALALIGLNQGLAPAAREALAAQPSAEADFILAHDRLRAGRADGGALIAARPGVVPEWALQEQAFPLLSRAARSPDRPLFAHADTRPQLVEVIEAPETALSAGRISAWSWSEERCLMRLAVLGGGPPQVRAAVAALITDLASRRASPADVVLAEAAFFDLSVPAPPPPPVDEDAVVARILDAARALGVEPAIREELEERAVRREAVEIVQQGREARPEATLANLRAAAAETGLVVCRAADPVAFQAAAAALARGTAAPAGAPFPLLTPYRRAGRPLHVPLPKRWAGANEGLEVAGAYARAALAAARRDDERRALRDSMAYVEAERLIRLRADLESGAGPPLDQRLVTTELTLNMTTGERELRPAPGKTALDLLDELPRSLLRLIARGVAADLVREALILPPDEAPPRWAVTTVFDAMLRGRTLPIADPPLAEAFAHWSAAWRGPALAALDAALRADGLSLEAVAVENTVVVASDPGAHSEYVEVELLHVHTPGLDRPPSHRGGATVFRPRWGERRRVLAPAREIQEEAAETIRRDIQKPRILGAALRPLAWDSGAATDALIQVLAHPLESQRFERTAARLAQSAGTRPDPVEAILLDHRRADDLARAAACAAAATKDAPPDLTAYELFLSGRGARDWAAELLRRPGAGPAGVRREDLVALAEMSAWGVVREIVRGAADEPPALPALAGLPALDPARLRAAFARLRARSPDYAARCLERGDQPPPHSTRRRSYAPHAYHGARRLAFDVMDGDAALALAEAASAAAGAAPAQARAILARQTTNPAFALVAASHARLSALVSGERAAPSDAFRRIALELREYAERRYHRAAARDSGAGTAWLRLARLYAATGRYQAALDALTGAEGRHPLGLAVRLGGGAVTVAPPEAPWPGPLALSAEVAEVRDFVTLRFHADGALVGSAVVSGLARGDAATIALLFRRTPPGALRSAGSASFAEWLLCVQTPALGRRAELARALAGPNGRLVAAALAAFGAAPLTPDSAPPPRPADWLDAEVVAALDWPTPAEEKNLQRLLHIARF